MYQIYRMAKDFGCRPSDFAFLDDSVGAIGRWYFDSGVWAFGEYVTTSISKAGQNSNPAIAQVQRTWEWERLLGGGNSGSGFADPSTSDHARVVGKSTEEDDDDEIILED